MKANDEDFFTLEKKKRKKRLSYTAPPILCPRFWVQFILLFLNCQIYLYLINLYFCKFLKTNLLSLCYLQTFIAAEIIYNKDL